MRVRARTRTGRGSSGCHSAVSPVLSQLRSQVRASWPGPVSRPGNEGGPEGVGEGMERPVVERRADEIAEAACELADAVSAQRWSPAAVDDAVDAIETLAEALLTARAEAAEVLVAVAGLRAALAPPGVAPPPPPAGRPRRRGLGPGWRGLRQPEGTAR